MTAIRLLIISGVQGDTRRYRSVHLAEQARMVGMQVTLKHVWQSGLLKLVRNKDFDIAVFQRVEMDRFANYLLREMRAKKSLCLYDTDDLIFDPQSIESIDSPDFADPIRFRLYRKAMMRQRDMLLACDGALVSTRTLAESVKVLGKPVKVHNNAFSLEMISLAEDAYARRRSTLNRILIGYASGTHTHDRDFSLVKDALLSLLDTCPQVDVWLIGQLNAGDGWEKYGSRVRQIPKVDWRELPVYLAQFDINLAPLVSGNPFSESKSAIKFMEAALLRCPTVASPVGEFKDAIKDGINGMLSKNDEWLDKLTRLADDPDLRKKIGEKAYEDVKCTYEPSSRCVELVNSLNSLGFDISENEIVNQPAEHDFQALSVEKWLENGYLAHSEQYELSDFQRGWVLLWRRGPIELLGNIWVFARRILAPLFPFRTEKIETKKTGAKRDIP